MRGKVWKFGENISTDLIIPGRFFHLRSNLEELAKHAFEDVEPDFVKKVAKGDFVAGGSNFGLGSSREHAAIVLKMAGVAAVIAKSFARIFFRNAINVGLPVVVCDTDSISAGNELEISLSNGVLRNITKGGEIKFAPLSGVMERILKDGGLVAHVKKHGDLLIR
jgi:3-isopropylmalate/(R)-2-methylmalate dehydratase small subunit